ncbi:hypothetical protein MMG00_13370 [Ignatzschineria rhizosphaerae]|uniref:Lipoprotein n=1 Tax=Ignatzschineria rhizosphaerae TaxID=2923279 RepID=A0ABY3X833_9GAMM|nr:hypothetical protein [Ignatzschineria rhizosphaerae]UNM96168.1 hypothetical protein MMG00_13370 [Ignatzschineria rhizosphaerae]
MKKLLFGLLPLLLAGCVNSTNIVEQENIATNDHSAIEQFKATRDQWIGKHIEERIEAIDKPNGTNKGRLGNFYTWRSYQTAGDGFFTPFVETICEETFKTDNNGIITEWTTIDCYY